MAERRILAVHDQAIGDAIIEAARSWLPAGISPYPIASRALELLRALPPLDPDQPLRVEHLSPEGNSLCEARDGRFVVIAGGELGDCPVDYGTHLELAEAGQWARWSTMTLAQVEATYGAEQA